MTFVAELEPAAVWKHFDAILTIPRGSTQEGRMREHVIALADRVGLAHQVDAAGNIVVRKPATPGCEDAPITILQSHLDMVQEKNADVDHDFARDPIIPVRADAYVTADGTTLGSDNGIGVAAMLAVMDAADLNHGPLELLFTIDEETGLTGAARLDADLLRGRRLINLDSEEEGVLYVGCAGGGDTTLRVPLATAPVEGPAAALTLALTGLKGGHSGCDIHLGRGNAVTLLARALWAALLDAPCRLARLTGGRAHNAIPREAFATLVVGHGDRARVQAVLEAEGAAITSEYAATDPGMTWAMAEDRRPETVWDSATTTTVLRLLNVLPHGVEAMSHDIPGMVETSVNLATVGVDGEVAIGLSSRSSIASSLAALRRRLRAAGLLAGAAVEDGPAYPGWRPDLESRLLRVVQAVHERELGAAPTVTAIHAGLECGVLGRKLPGIDMISFGPVIECPHSPDERVLIESVGRFYRLLAATLAALGGA